MVLIDLQDLGVDAFANMCFDCIHHGEGTISNRGFAPGATVINVHLRSPVSSFRPVTWRGQHDLKMNPMPSSLKRMRTPAPVMSCLQTRSTLSRSYAQLSESTNGLLLGVVDVMFLILHVLLIQWSHVHVNPFWSTRNSRWTTRTKNTERQWDTTHSPRRCISNKKCTSTSRGTDRSRNSRSGRGSNRPWDPGYSSRRRHGLGKNNRTVRRWWTCRSRRFPSQSAGTLCSAVRLIRQVVSDLLNHAAWYHDVAPAMRKRCIWIQERAHLWTEMTLKRHSLSDATPRTW